MEMPKGWKRLCDDIGVIENDSKSNDNQWFLWHTADLIKQMAEALEFVNEEADWYSAIGPTKVSNALKKFKEWK